MVKDEGDGFTLCNVNTVTFELQHVQIQIGIKYYYALLSLHNFAHRGWICKTCRLLIRSKSTNE